MTVVVWYIQRSIWTVALLPRKCKNLSAYMQPILTELSDLREEYENDENNVYDAFEKCKRSSCLLPLFFIYDVRGGPLVTGQLHGGSENGTCISCDVVGIRWSKGRTAYLNAVTYLQKNDPLRKKWMTTFKLMKKDAKV